MNTGFQKIIEQRIQAARKNGAFDNLPGSGKPLELEDDRMVPEELRMAYKILKNADCLPPEIELKKQIQQTEDLLAGMQDTAERYRTLKKLNFLIMKLNAMRQSSIAFDMPQHYESKLVDRFASTNGRESKMP